MARGILWSRALGCNWPCLPPPRAVPRGQDRRARTEPSRWHGWVDPPARSNDLRRHGAARGLTSPGLAGQRLPHPPTLLLPVGGAPPGGPAPPAPEGGARKNIAGPQTPD